MDSQLFLYINVAAAALLFLWFISARKGRGPAPTRLNLKNPVTQPQENDTVTKAVVNKTAHFERNSAEDSAVRKAKSLNVLFLYNGHDWDAYEVLGLPAGTSLPLVTERYQQLVKNADSGQLEFYEAAYQTILKKL